MLKNYIVIAIRNIQNHSVYSFINVFGLTLGIVSSVMIFLFIRHEMSYDQFHSKSDRIYRVATHAVLGETEFHGPVTMSPLGPAIYTDYPEVEDFVRINVDRDRQLFNYGEAQYFEDKVYYADSSFFKMFDFILLEGSLNDCLKKPKSIVLSQSLASKYFGEKKALGEVIKIGGDETPYKVTGVMEDPIETSHLKPRALKSYSSLDEGGRNSWGNLNEYTYILLPEKYDPAEFNKKFPEVYDKYVSKLFSQFNASAEFYLQPLEDIHLHSNLEGEIEPPGSVQFLVTFSAIGFFLILIASINYMNLATARSVSRSREVGIRKAMGSYRIQLIYQFITESVVICLVALLISAIITFFLIPYFNEFAQISISQDFMLDPETFIVLLAIVLFVGLIGGSYPALVLSGFKAVDVIKGKTINQGGSDRLRKFLVISQFSISMIMVICTWIVFDQLAFLKSKDLGFNKEQVVVIPMNGEEVRKKMSVLSTELLNSPYVASVGSGNAVPGSENYDMNGIRVETPEGNFIEAVFQDIRIDDQYLPTLEIPIVQGRNFNKNIKSDSAESIIVNEELVRYMGWKNAIGKKFLVFTNPDSETKETKVIGVIRDFHVRALQEPITPLVIRNRISNESMVVRFKGNDYEKSLSEIEKIFKKVVSNRPFTYTFLDQNFEKQYLRDQKRGEVFVIFSLLTVAIACLGLFGLASFTAQSRRKEIGVRKVVGAQAITIVIMMTKELLKLVVVSSFIAFPIAFYFMDQWLDGFAFRTEMTWGSYLLSALIIVSIAFVSILYQALRSAWANPIWSLRED